MPELPDALVEKIFLGFPPDEPAALVRVSLASKHWLAVLTGPAFRCRYRQFHGAPPMLGFLYRHNRPRLPRFEENPPTRFICTAEFGPLFPDFPPWHRLDAWDCRHGRVLFVNGDVYPPPLVVWDPMTGSTRKLAAEMAIDTFGFAVLCAVSGCDHRHRACQADPFKVVYVGVEKSKGESVALAFVSSPDAGDWSKPIPSSPYQWKWEEPCPGLDLADPDVFIRDMPSVLVDDALYFLLGYELDGDRVGILKYSLSSDSLSQIDQPLNDSSVEGPPPILMATKDGSLGFAHVDELTLHVWTRKIGSDGGAPWIHGRVVDLEKLLPVKNSLRSPRPIGSVEGDDIIFVKTDLAVYEIDLKMLQWKERRTYRFLVKTGQQIDL